jgi:hypothetical protein
MIIIHALNVLAEIAKNVKKILLPVKNVNLFSSYITVNAENPVQMEQLKNQEYVFLAIKTALYVLQIDV